MNLFFSGFVYEFFLRFFFSKLFENFLRFFFSIESKNTGFDSEDIATIIAERNISIDANGRYRKTTSTKNAERVHSQLNEFGEAVIEMDGVKFLLEVEKGTNLENLQFDPFLELRILRTFGISMSGIPYQPIYYRKFCNIFFLDGGISMRPLSEAYFDDTKKTKK